MTKRPTSRQVRCSLSVSHTLLREGPRSIFGPDDPTGRAFWWCPLVHLQQQPGPAWAIARSLYRPEMYWDDTQPVIVRTAQWTMSDNRKNRRQLATDDKVGIVRVEYRLLPVPFPRKWQLALANLACGASTLKVADPCLSLHPVAYGPIRVKLRPGRRRAIFVRSLHINGTRMEWLSTQQRVLNRAWQRFWNLLARTEESFAPSPGFIERYDANAFRDGYFDLDLADPKAASKLAEQT